MVAFGELYDRYAPQALTVARSVCRDPGLAEEAVQDAFESIWTSRSTYREDRGPVAAWAMSVVRYRAMALAGRRRRRLAAEFAQASPEQASAPEAVADQAGAGADSMELIAALQRIPAAQREVIALAFYGQLSHAEISAHLNLPAGTVKGRMRLGLGKLRCGLDRAA
jgi:RNA polymerase sigma-70 factor (ECF subfamily)